MKKSEIFENTIHHVAEALNNRAHTPFVVGGWAVNFHGVVRSTLDFDMMILEDDYKIALETFIEAGYKLAVKTELYARFESEESIIQYIDCLFANRKTYDIISCEGEKISLHGSDFILPSPKHLIAMKLHAVKHGERHRGGKDFDDIIDLINANDIDIHTGEFEEWCLKYGDHEILRRIKDEIL